MTRILSAALVTTLLGGSAFAQDAVPEAAPPAPTEAAPPSPMTPAVVAPAEPAAAAPAADSGVQVSIFADAFYNWSTSKNDVNAFIPGGMNKAPSHRAYNRYNGFGLSFFGADLTYNTEKFGATTSLRFGPSVPIFYAADKGPTGIDNITQAYLTYKPTTALAIDFGQFSTIYGAEVAESWKNLNYTRGGLYYAMQPFWHTGVRAKYTISDELSFTGMVVNGVNNEIDGGKERPSIGVQAAYAKDNIAVLLGYLGSLDPDTDVYFDHFVDLVATASFGNVSLVLNGDFAKDEEAQFYGGSLAARIGLTDELGVAARLEYLGDPDGLIWAAGDNNVITATGTFEYKPDASGKLILRWDNRFEKSKEQIFTDRDGAGADTWFQSVLGVVVTSS
ncbi:MAG: outer membrane beta-barrel protein [Deltaproteobacteria bacterium]|nr:outer membrane beta-barrel protein [Deltaproteobacteria bacterium]